MPKAVYSEFGTDEVQSPADETVQGFIDQVFLLNFFSFSFICLNFYNFKLKNEIIAKTGPTDALKAIHYYKRVHGAPIYYVYIYLNPIK